VDLAVYAVDGRRVRTLVQEDREPGEYEAVWDGRDDAGNATGTGIYYIRLITRHGRFVRRVTHLK
jgi:flagellar hook assembly protein FlgD